MKPQDIITGKASLWIFGYGSLVWKPDFKYKRSEVGYINGYKRRFWHGDNFHRGNDELVRCVICLLTSLVTWQTSCCDGTVCLAQTVLGVARDVTCFSSSLCSPEEW